jgi:hypothetical protein
MEQSSDFMDHSTYFVDFFRQNTRISIKTKISPEIQKVVCVSTRSIASTNFPKSTDPETPDPETSVVILKLFPEFSKNS